MRSGELRPLNKRIDLPVPSPSLPTTTLSSAAAAGAAKVATELAPGFDFAALFKHRGRMLQVECALPHMALIPEQMVASEAVNRPFSMVLDCVSLHAYFDPAQLVGEQVTVRLLQPDDSYRPWHGYVFKASQLGADGGLARYRLVIRPWLSFLGGRRNACVWQDKTTLQIIEDLFKAYAQANTRFDVSEPLPTRAICTQYRETDLEFFTRLLAEEGLSYHFEHLDGADAEAAGAQAHSLHRLVITGAASARASIGIARFSSPQLGSTTLLQRDSVEVFVPSRQVQPNAVAIAAWDYQQVAGPAAETTSALDLGELPSLEIYDASGAATPTQGADSVTRQAALALAAHDFAVKRFEGSGTKRNFSAGLTFHLIDHPLYGANTTDLSYAGAISASRARPDNEFVLLKVEHRASNDLGGDAAKFLRLAECEHGSYSNRFTAAPAVATMVAPAIGKPTVHGAQTAVIVGVPGESVTADRDLRVKIQFAWQRGQRPLPGGLGTESSGGPGNASSDETSGTWVRVAVPAAGPNWGSVLVPRIGTEVAVEFMGGDIDHPVITGQLHNGADLPPFSAGEESGANHSGVISGLHSPTLDRAGFNQWVIDDATNQLRMRLVTSAAQSELGMGHLLGQAAGSADRGSWSGSGFSAATEGWASVRGGHGLLLTATVQEGSYGSAAGTQMAATDSVAQMRGAEALGRRVAGAAQASGALGLPTFTAGKAVAQLADTIDATRDGRHTAPVGAQEARKAEGRTLSDPVEAFARPVIVLDTPSAAVLACQGSTHAFSGENAAFAAQGDLHQTAAHTYSSISGGTTSLFTQEAGLKAFAAQGAVSLRSHVDELKILADQDVTLISVNDEIRIQAKRRIELVTAGSSVVLDGANITFTTPGKFQVKAAAHAFLGGATAPSEPLSLPSGAATVPLTIGNPLQAVYAQTLRYDVNGDHWLPSPLGRSASVLAGDERLSALPRARGDAFSSALVTAKPQPVQYWLQADAPWTCEESIEAGNIEERLIPSSNDE